MSISPPPKTFAEWIARRRAERPDPALEKARQDLNILNVRYPGWDKNGGNPPVRDSTDRLNNADMSAILNQMVEQRLDATFTALADPTRRAMLAELKQGEKTVGELAAPMAMTFAGAAKHVGVLERAGLVERRREGRRQYCRLRAEPLKEAEAFLRQWEQFWTTRLDALEALLKEQPQ